MISDIARQPGPMQEEALAESNVSDHAQPLPQTFHPECQNPEMKPSLKSAGPFLHAVSQDVVLILNSLGTALEKRFTGDPYQASFLRDPTGSEPCDILRFFKQSPPHVITRAPTTMGKA